MRVYGRYLHPWARLEELSERPSLAMEGFKQWERKESIGEDKP